jgi:hypothetical protein
MDLYRMYTGAFATAGQTLINLQPVPAAGGSSGPASEATPPAAPKAPSSGAQAKP